MVRAYDMSAEAVSERYTFGPNCKIYRNFTPSTKSAFVKVMGDDGRQLWPEGFYWSAGMAFTDAPKLTTQDLEYCLDIPGEYIRGFQTLGWEVGKSFEQQSKQGVAFMLTQEANYPGTWFEYGIGAQILPVGGGATIDLIPIPRLSVALSSSATGYKQSGTFSVTATFSEEVTGFELSDVTVGNGSASNLVTTSASVYTFDVAPATDGEVTVNIGAGKAVDAEGKNNTASNSISVTADGTPPAVVLTSNANDPHSGVFTVTATFSEDVSGFAITDVTVTNGSASNPSGTSASVYTFDVTPTADGVVTVDVAADVAEDAATNGNTAATRLSVNSDGTAPTVTLSSSADDPHSGAFTATATFSEPVTGFTLSDLTVGNGTATNFQATSTTVYTFDVTPTADGVVTVDVAADVAEDAATNGNTAATRLSVNSDGTAPTVTLSSNANNPHSGVFTTTATFSEAVTGFAVGDVAVGNGTASNFQATSATVYTFDVTPTADGAVTVDVAADVAEDAATNGNTAATQLSVTTDNTAPVVTISGPTEVVVDDFTVTLTFSEVVTGFAAEDITVTNGEKGTFTETTAGKVYTLIVTPDLGTTVGISVSADKAQDAAGNGNEASNLFEVTAGSPASEFEDESANIKQDIVTEVQNTLQNAVTANVRMVKEAKSRFIAGTRSSPNGSAGFAGQNNVPFDVDGVANGTAMRLSTNGTFFGQVGNDEGTKRRVFSGDFSIVGEKGGSVTGSISGKVAWEQNLSDKTMYGYFIGAQVNQTDIKTTFTGKQQGYGVNIGSYVVNEVAENVYINGFVSLGMGKSDLDMSNDVLSLDGSYETKSATIGGALTGVYDMESYEFWPELAFTAGKTQVGTAKFTGRAYGLVDNNLSLDAGDVTVANLTLRPEVRIPLEAGNQSGATSQVTVAPRAICERITTDVTTENCGRGAELGFIRRSGDGLTQITGRLSRDYVGTSTRTGLELKLEHRF